MFHHKDFFSWMCVKSYNNYVGVYNNWLAYKEELDIGYILTYPSKFFANLFRVVLFLSLHMFAFTSLLFTLQN